MSKEKRTPKKPFTVRCSIDDKKHFERTLGFIIESEGFTGKDERVKAFRWMCDQALLGFDRDATPRTRSEVEALIQCDYLRRGLATWLCGETMRKKKVPTDLGNDPELVVAGCLDCIRKREELHAIAINKILVKLSIVKMREFYLQFMKLSRDGLGVDCLMCRAELLDGITQMSVDGASMRCPQLDNQYVSIEEVCLQKVNPQMGLGCEFFISVEHFVDLDDMGIIQRKEVSPNVAPQPCGDYIEDKCPGPDECLINQKNLARAHKYCPERYHPDPISNLLLEGPEEKGQALPELPDGEEETTKRDE